MTKPLRLLIVEDSEDDAALLVRELRRGGYMPTFERVETRATMSAALSKQTWDVVISDHSLPRFGGLGALSLLKERGLDLPFILVSGTIGEETAVEAMKAGAHDYVLKDKLTRLVPAIERELREFAVRSERKRIQEQLLLSDRMASVGILAAGVAHEINNPLSVVIANLDFVVNELSKLGQDGALRSAGHDVQEPIQDAREAAERVRGIVRDLKVFSRAEEERRGPVDVRGVLESSLRIAGNEIRHRARLVKDYAEVPPVLANEARLGQVFLNLIVNAAQAIPEGRAEKNEIRVRTQLETSGCVRVEVQDTGSGIPPAILPRIFDAFFTTKPVGVGTGLGLAICHRIVTGLGGEIAVESEVGKGSVFRIVLPVARTDVAEAKSLPAPSVTGRRGRILVVDDEVMLGRAVRRMLASEHDVVAVTQAGHAIDLISRGERFDVILCDLMMPEITGMDLHAELLRIAADQAEKMVFVTGGAFTPSAREFLDRAPNLRFEKPFDKQSLRALIHSKVR